jgi:hypothetical protein
MASKSCLSECRSLPGIRYSSRPTGDLPSAAPFLTLYVNAHGIVPVSNLILMANLAHWAKVKAGEGRSVSQSPQQARHSGPGSRTYLLRRSLPCWRGWFPAMVCTSLPIFSWFWRSFNCRSRSRTSHAAAARWYWHRPGPALLIGSHYGGNPSPDKWSSWRVAGREATGR